MPKHSHRTNSPQKMLFRILLLWLGLPVLLVVAAIFIYAGLSIRQEYMAKNKEEISATALWNRDILREKIDAACFALSLVGAELHNDLLDEQKAAQNMTLLWKHLQTSFKWAEGLGLFTNKNKITVGDFPSVDTAELKKRVSFMGQPSPQITDVHTGADGLPRFFILMPLADQGGTLCLSVNAQLFNAYLEKIRIGRTGEVFLVNAAGILQSRSLLHGAPLNRIDHAFASEPLAKIQARTWNGTRLWFSTLPVDSRSDWLLVAQWDEREMTHLADSHLASLAAWGLAAILLLASAWALTIKKVDTWGRKTRAQQASLEEERMRVRKLDAVSQLSVGIAHEVNNPLAIIGEEAGWMQDLLKREALRDIPDAKDLRDSLHQIVLQTARCREITHKLLAFGGKTDGIIRDLDLNTLITDTLLLRRRDAAQKQVEIIEDMAELPRIHSEPALLRQILQNLIGNALDAMPEGGRITISTGVTENGGVFLRVQDSGFGIAKENLPKIFDPFFTTKDPGKGSGLGLSTCHGILQRLDGTISMESQPGQGTTVTIELPREARSRQQQFEESGV